MFVVFFLLQFILLVVQTLTTSKRLCKLAFHWSLTAQPFAI